MTWSNQVDPNVVKAEVNEILLKQLSGGPTHRSALLSPKISDYLEVRTDIGVYGHLYHKQ